MNAIKNTVSFLFLMHIVFSLTACQSGYQTSKSTAKTNSGQTTKSSQSGSQKTQIVQPGDTLYGISFRAGLNYKDVALWNGIDEPYTIKVGQKIRLTAPSSIASNATVNKNVAVSSNQKTTQTKPVVVTATPAVPIEPTVLWQWPTKGELIGLYVANDKTNQGINIDGKAGQKIVAAADGIVVYSGAGLIGYGELIIVKHNNEWISAYAHNEKRLVAEGVKVKAGQHIANMGRTGSARDMLHFEIRRNGRPVDPLLHLPKR